MIKLIVGLGNPGQQYEKNRHNVGFLFLDRLATEFGGLWSSELKFQALFTEISTSSGKLMLLKPSTFMNRSGTSVGKVIRYYKLSPEQLLVVHDELDFDVGVIKLKKDGGHAGHNGLRDIISHLETKNFYRLRIGIGRPLTGKSVADFVLSNPSNNEWDVLLASFDLPLHSINQMALSDMSLISNKLNSQIKFSCK